MVIEFNKKNENPFYGLRNCLSIFQKIDKILTFGELDLAFAELKTKEQREMFFSLMFSMGDITSRQHNIFKNIQKDNGGNANRDGFEVFLDWLWVRHRQQFIKFLNTGLFNEYTCFDLLFKNRVQTQGQKLLKVTSKFSDKEYCQVLLEYLHKVINSNNTFNKHLVAKFLTLPRLSVRSGHKKMLDATRQIMQAKVNFLVNLSSLMGWEYEVHGNYSNFKGYRAWRKEYNADLESVLFSTGEIKKFDKDSFIKWFDHIPAQARFRVKNRILYSKKDDKFKYPKLQEYYKLWEENKLKLQKEQRILEEKVRQNQASEDDLKKLKQVKKDAKVTVGATNFRNLYEDIRNGRIDQLKLESFMNRVNLPYNSLVIMDDSGSMSGAPFRFAQFMAATCLIKNPDDEGRNLLGFFNNQSRLYGYISEQSVTPPNSLLRRNAGIKVHEPFVNPELSFYENYQRISNFCASVFQNGGTNISSIPEGFKQMCDNHPEIKDALASYPIWTIISDGEWNNMHSPEASMNDFFRRCENYFGYRPFIIAIDINGSWGTLRTDVNRFAGIDNMIYIPANPAQIEQFLVNFKDMDTFDIFTPLQSIYRSNRYELVRNAVI